MQNSLSGYNQMAITISTIFLLALSAYYLIELVVLAELDVPLFYYPRFWIAVGLLIYSGVAVFVFSLLKLFLITGDKQTAIYFSYINNYTFCICNLIYSWGILCNVCIKK